MSPQDDTPPLEEIYRELQRGAGHQWVNDDNVQALIDMAVSNRHRLIEVQLREWRASCAPAPEDEEDLPPDLGSLDDTTRQNRPASPRH